MGFGLSRLRSRNRAWSISAVVKRKIKRRFRERFCKGDNCHHGAVGGVIRICGYDDNGSGFVLVVALDWIG